MRDLQCRNCGAHMPVANGHEPCAAGGLCEPEPHHSHRYRGRYSGACVRCALDVDAVDSVLPCAADVGREDAIVAASRYLHVWKCPGYATNGNLYRCHPNAEPNAGYDVAFGMIGPFNAEPLPFDEAVAFATTIALWVGRAIIDDRAGGATAMGLREPFLDTLTPTMFEQTDPGMTQIPILREMVSTGMPLRHAPTPTRPQRFTVGRISVPWDEMMWLERAGYVIREPGSPRESGARLLTERGREIGDAACDARQRG